MVILFVLRPFSRIFIKIASFSLFLSKVLMSVTISKLLYMWAFFLVGIFPVGIFLCGHFSLWAFFPVGIFPCGHFSLWAFFPVGIFPCGHFSLWAFFPVGIFPCGHFSLWAFFLWAFFCGHFSCGHISGHLLDWYWRSQGDISWYGQTDTVLESSYGNMSAHKKFQLKAQN